MHSALSLLDLLKDFRMVPFSMPLAVYKITGYHHWNNTEPNLIERGFVVHLFKSALIDLNRRHELFLKLFSGVYQKILAC